MLLPNDVASLKDKTLPGMSVLKHLPAQSDQCSFSQLSFRWHLGEAVKVILPDRNMRYNILRCLLKAGLGVSNSHCCRDDKLECMSKSNQGSGWKKGLNQPTEMRQHQCELVGKKGWVGQPGEDHESRGILKMLKRTTTGDFLSDSAVF